MKNVILFAAVTAALAGTGYAQMNPLPPASSTDGVMIQPIGLNAGSDHWDSPSTLGSFKGVSATNGTAPINTPAYNPTGLTFGSMLPASFQTHLNTVNTDGGIIRAIFLGESAGWLDSFGYTYSGSPSGPGSFTAFERVEANSSTSTPVNTQFGQYFDVNLAAGAANSFDFWFQGDNMAGGDFTLIHPANSVPMANNVMWAQQSIAANTWNATLGQYVDIATYVVGLEDWRGGDADFSDGVYAFQFYTPSGAPIVTTPVPEPSTYGLLGAAALLGLVAARRFTRKNAAPRAA